MRPGYLVGAYVCRQPETKGNNMFVQYGNRLYLVSPESVRPAVGYEQWTPTSEDIESLRRAEGSLRVGTWTDVTADAPPDQHESLSPSVVLDPSTGAPVPADGSPLVVVPHVPAPAVARPLEEPAASSPPPLAKTSCSLSHVANTERSVFGAISAPWRCSFLNSRRTHAVQAELSIGRSMPSEGGWKRYLSALAGSPPGPV